LRTSRDIGDGWYHGQAVNDQAFVSTGARSDIALICDGPLLTRFRVADGVAGARPTFASDRMTRSDEFAELVIDSFITLRQGCDRIEVRTTVRNSARDHRLRVLFPTGVQAKTYLADGALLTWWKGKWRCRRTTTWGANTPSNRVRNKLDGVSDSRRGLAVISMGLLESCVRDLPERHRR